MQMMGMYDYVFVYLINLHGREREFQILQLRIFVWGDLVQVAKLVGIYGFIASQVEGGGFRGSASSWDGFGMSA